MALTTDLFVPGRWPQLLLVPGCEQMNNYPPSFLSGDKRPKALVQLTAGKLYVFSSHYRIRQTYSLSPATFSQAAPLPLRATKAGW